MMTLHFGVGVLPTAPIAFGDSIVAEADAAGFDAVMVPDHLMAWFSRAGWSSIGNIATMMPSPHVFMDPIPLIAAWAQRTEHVRFVTSVTDAIRRSPAQVAVTALTLGHVTEGRFVLGLGCGEAENCLPYGSPFDRPVARLEEALQIIRRLWTEDSVSFRGEFATLDRAVCDLEPYDDVHPPIWIGAHGPRSLDITGTYGDGWLPFLPMTAEQYGERLARVHAAAERAGRDPSTIVAAYNTPVCIADDHEKAHAMIAAEASKQLSLALSNDFFAHFGMKHPLGIDNGLTHYIPEWLTERELNDALAQIPDALVAHDLLIHGTPSEVAQKLERFEEAGLQHFSPLDTTPFTSLADMPGAMKRIVEVATLVASR